MNFDFMIAGPGIINEELRVVICVNPKSGYPVTVGVTAETARRFADDILRAASYVDPIEGDDE